MLLRDLFRNLSEYPVRADKFFPSSFIKSLRELVKEEGLEGVSSERLEGILIGLRVAYEYFRTEGMESKGFYVLFALLTTCLQDREEEKENEFLNYLCKELSRIGVRDAIHEDYLRKVIELERRRLRQKARLKGKLKKEEEE